MSEKPSGYFNLDWSSGDFGIPYKTPFRHGRCYGGLPKTLISTAARCQVQLGDTETQPRRAPAAQTIEGAETPK